MNEQRRRVSIVAPFYNEGESVDYFREALGAVFSQLPDVDFEVVCVDDGSRDDTLGKLIAVAANDSRYTSCNCGTTVSLALGDAPLRR
jgi:glycosyltransferase involved in cell wall biosynthesis